jgi:hypothetical protein
MLVGDMTFVTPATLIYCGEPLKLVSQEKLFLQSRCTNEQSAAVSASRSQFND